MADVLWTKRQALLEQKYRLEDEIDASSRPKPIDTWLLDRVTLEIAYGNTYNWAAGGINEPYRFTGDEKKWYGEIKYTIPLNAWRSKRPAPDKVKGLRDYTAAQARADFFDFVYDLRIALAKWRATDGPEKIQIRLLAKKYDAKIRNMTHEYGYMMECLE